MQTHENQLPVLTAALEDIQAIDTNIIDVKEHTSVTDYMVICSGRSSRHIKAVAEAAIEAMKKAGFKPFSHSGLNQGDWVLVDFGDIVLHVMQKDSRAFYNLEGLWQDAHNHDA